MFYAVVVLLLVALVLWEFASSELLSYLSTVFSTWKLYFAIVKGSFLFVHMEVIFVQAYVKMYQGDELPEPKSMLQASQSSCVVLILFTWFNTALPSSVGMLPVSAGECYTDSWWWNGKLYRRPCCKDCWNTSFVSESCWLLAEPAVPPTWVVCELTWV